MGDGSVLAQLQIPPVVLGVEAEVDDLFFQEVEPLFALAAADDLADFWNKYVHRGDGFAIVVGAHVEGFDLRGIVGEDDRFFAVFFGKIALMLRLKIAAPFDGKLKRFVRLFQDLDRFCVGQVGKGRIERHASDARSAPFR